MTGADVHGGPHCNTSYIHVWQIQHVIHNMLQLHTACLTQHVIHNRLYTKCYTQYQNMSYITYNMICLAQRIIDHIYIYMQHWVSCVDARCVYGCRVVWLLDHWSLNWLTCILFLAWLLRQSALTNYLCYPTTVCEGQHTKYRTCSTFQFILDSPIMPISCKHNVNFFLTTCGVTTFNGIVL